MQGSAVDRRWYRCALGVLPLALAVLTACADRSEQLGEPVDVSKGVPISRLPGAGATGRPESLVVSGRISEVCSSSGCWFVLSEVVDGKVHELLVDLKPRSTFTVPARLRGREAVVKGHLVGAEPDWKLLASGMVVQ